MAQYTYDAYGSPAIYNRIYSEASFFINPFLFTGREADILDNGSLKIQYNRNRSYDYTTGRWLQRDPLGASPSGITENDFILGQNIQHCFNLYDYGVGNPNIYSDPYGLFSWPPLNLNWTWARNSSGQPVGSVDVSLNITSVPIIEEITGRYNMSLTISGVLGWTSDTQRTCCTVRKPLVWGAPTHSIQLWPLNQAHAYYSVGANSPNASVGIGLSVSTFYDAVWHWGLYYSPYFRASTFGKFWVSKYGCAAVSLGGVYKGTAIYNGVVPGTIAAIVTTVYAPEAAIAIAEALKELLEGAASKAPQLIPG